MENAMIFGTGPMGLLMGIALRTSGVSEIVFTDIDDARIDLATSFAFIGVAGGSADLENCAMASTFPSTRPGVPMVAGGLVNYIANGGKGLFFGVCPSDVRIEISPFEIFRRQLTLADSHSQHPSGARHD